MSSPPQLQLLSRYIGPFSADTNLFGSILRTYISVNGVEFIPDTVCVFDGVQNVLERCNTWYEDRLSGDKAKELVRNDEKDADKAPVELEHGHDISAITSRSSLEYMETDHGPSSEMAPGVQFFVAEPIVDRKSSFIGRACRISDPSQVRWSCFVCARLDFPPLAVHLGRTSTWTSNGRSADSAGGAPNN